MDIYENDAIIKDMKAIYIYIYISYTGVRLVKAKSAMSLFEKNIGMKSVTFYPYVISSVLFIMMINPDWENILCNILAWGHLEFIIIRSEVLMSLLKMILWMGK